MKEFVSDKELHPEPGCNKNQLETQLNGELMLEPGADKVLKLEPGPDREPQCDNYT